MMFSCPNRSYDPEMSTGSIYPHFQVWFCKCSHFFRNIKVESHCLFFCQRPPRLLTALICPCVGGTPRGSTNSFRCTMTFSERIFGRRKVYPPLIYFRCFINPPCLYFRGGPTNILFDRDIHYFRLVAPLLFFGVFRFFPRLVYPPLRNGSSSPNAPPTCLPTCRPLVELIPVYFPKCFPAKFPICPPKCSPNNLPYRPI